MTPVRSTVPSNPPATTASQNWFWLVVVAYLGASGAYLYYKGSQ